MNLTIYIDVLFLLNMIIDYIILNSCSLLIGQNPIKWRMLSASALGALYSVIIFFLNTNGIILIFLNVIASFVINIIAYKFTSVISTIKSFIVYYTINMLYGGGIYAFYHFTSLGSKMNCSNGVYYIDLPLWIIILLSFFFYFLTKAFNKIANQKNIYKNLKIIEIHILNKKFHVKALFDTGNTLYDPISLLPVMIIESTAIKDILNISLFEDTLTSKNDSLLILHKIYPELKLRLIPFKSITGEKNSIYAFKPDKIIDTENSKVISNTLIGIVNVKLSEDGSYNALLHSNN